MRYLKRGPLIAAVVVLSMTAPAGAAVAVEDEIVSVTERMDSAVAAGEVTFENQTTSGENVTVASVNLSKGGFVGIVGEDRTLIGVSAYLAPGEHTDITVTLDESIGDPDATANLTAVALRDGNGNQQSDGPANPEHCLMLVNGQPIEDRAVVTVG